MQGVFLKNGRFSIKYRLKSIDFVDFFLSGMGPSWAPQSGPTGPNIFGWSSPVGLWFTTFRHFDRPRHLYKTWGNRKFSFEEPNTP